MSVHFYLPCNHTQAGQNSKKAIQDIQYYYILQHWARLQLHCLYHFQIPLSAGFKRRYYDKSSLQSLWQKYFKSSYQTYCFQGNPTEPKYTCHTHFCSGFKKWYPPPIPVRDSNPYVPDGPSQGKRFLVQVRLTNSYRHKGFSHKQWYIIM